MGRIAPFAYERQCRQSKARALVRTSASCQRHPQARPQLSAEATVSRLQAGSVCRADDARRTPSPVRDSSVYELSRARDVARSLRAKDGSHCSKPVDRPEAAGRDLLAGSAPGRNVRVSAGETLILVNRDQRLLDAALNRTREAYERADTDPRGPLPVPGRVRAV